MTCKNCNDELHAAHAIKYGGYCLGCSNMGVPEKDAEIARLRGIIRDEITRLQINGHYPAAGRLQRRLERGNEMEPQRDKPTLEDHEQRLTAVQRDLAEFSAAIAKEVEELKIRVTALEGKVQQ